MSSRIGLIAGEILECLLEAQVLIPRPLEDPYSWVKRVRNYETSRHVYNVTANRMAKRGLVKIMSKNGKKFIKITKKGELEILLQKAVVVDDKPKWDGKWRLVTFDIPESSRDKRAIFRKILRKNNFKKLQASVFISPSPFNREALEYLKQTGLINYIRIMRVDDMDDDKKLRKSFNLP